MTTTTTSTTATKSASSRTSAEPAHSTCDLRRAKTQLANLGDELELFGWSPPDTARYARQALRALPLTEVIKLFGELVAEERSYYSHHAPLLDDQLDHTPIGD